jgi:hypothetical protein
MRNSARFVSTIALAALAATASATASMAGGGHGGGGSGASASHASMQSSMGASGHPSERSFGPLSSDARPRDMAQDDPSHSGHDPRRDCQYLAGSYNGLFGLGEC